MEDLPIDSLVSIGICDGLSGMIHAHNQTLFIEPSTAANESSGLDNVHVIYPLLPSALNLENDQSLPHQSSRTKRSSISLHRFLQIDYDEEGNEIVDTIHQEELGEDVEEDDSNSIDDYDEDDEALILDSYSEIEDYDVHPQPAVIEATSLEDAIKKNNGTDDDIIHSNDVIDGFPVDNLWEGKITYYFVLSIHKKKLFPYLF